jgi:hypothetical protein
MPHCHRGPMPSPAVSPPVALPSAYRLLMLTRTNADHDPSLALTDDESSRTMSADLAEECQVSLPSLLPLTADHIWSPGARARGHLGNLSRHAVHHAPDYRGPALPAAGPLWSFTKP